MYSFFKFIIKNIFKKIVFSHIHTFPFLHEIQKHFTLLNWILLKSKIKLEKKSISSPSLKRKKKAVKKKQAKLIYSVRCQDNDKPWAGKRVETGKASKGD